MRYKKAKLLWKISDCQKKIFCIDLNDDVEYYSFLREMHEEGYRQVIITSEIMVHLIEYFVIEKGLFVSDLEFMEDDEELKNEITELITVVFENKAFLSRLIEKLNFLSEKSSIDIQRIYFKGRNQDGVAVNFYLQSNGIIGIDKKNFLFVSNEVSNLIERCLF